VEGARLIGAPAHAACHDSGNCSQQAIAGAKLANLKNGQRPTSAPGQSLFPDAEPTASPISAAVAAEITGASERSIGRGKVVLDKGARRSRQGSGEGGEKGRA
jgi:hypothetical protein